MSRPLAIMALRVGPELARIGGVARTDPGGVFGERVQLAVQAANEAQREAGLREIRSVWGQFDPDADAYVLCTTRPVDASKDSSNDARSDGDGMWERYDPQTESYPLAQRGSVDVLRFDDELLCLDWLKWVDAGLRGEGGAAPRGR